MNEIFTAESPQADGGGGVRQGGEPHGQAIFMNVNDCYCYRSTFLT